MFCRYCGFEVAATQKFCKQCGKQQLLELNEEASAGTVFVGVFVWICIGLLTLTSLKMMGDENYLGMAGALLGAGAIVALYYLWEKFSAKQTARADLAQSRQLDFSTDKLLAVPTEQASVIEADTKRFEAEPVAVPRQAERN